MKSWIHVAVFTITAAILIIWGGKIRSEYTRDLVREVLAEYLDVAASRVMNRCSKE